VDGHHVDARVPQRLEHVLQLGFEHGEVAIDDRVLLFTTVTSVLTSIVFGMLPALSASRLDLAAAFKA